MFNLHIYLGIAGGVFSLGAYAPYIFSVVKRKTNPVLASWITWTLSTYIILLSSYSLGVRDTIWVPLAYAVGCTLVTLMAFKYGTRGWSRFDKSCMTAVVVSIIAWYVFDNALIALLLNIFIDFLGYLPTIKKLLFEKREQEDTTAWGFHFFGTFFNILALSSWTIEALYPIVLFAMNTSTFVLAVRNKWASKSL